MGPIGGPLVATRMRVPVPFFIGSGSMFEVGFCSLCLICPDWRPLCVSDSPQGISSGGNTARLGRGGGKYGMGWLRGCFLATTCLPPRFCAMVTFCGHGAGFRFSGHLGASFALA